MTAANGVDRPIFLIGCGRSGTTLLYELIAQQTDLAWFSNVTQRFPALPQLAAASRTAGLPLVRRLAGHRAPHPAEGHAIFDRVRGGSRREDEGVLTGHDVREGEAEQLLAIVRAHQLFHGKSRFLNKNTRNARRVSYLAAIFPDARFVHVVRDPRATAASLLRVAFWPELRLWWQEWQTPTELVAGGAEPALLAADFWTHEVNQIDRDGLEVSRDRWLEVRYEDLVDDVRGQVQRITAFSELACEAAFLDRVAERQVGSRNNKYLSLFSSADLDGMWRVAGPTAVRHGYEPVPRSIERPA
ncbi:MAG: sulfotransferase family protein [Mycobacteriales bacterium]